MTMLAVDTGWGARMANNADSPEKTAKKVKKQTEHFFTEAREQSVVKATIVEKYFDAWAGIICGAQNKWTPTGDNRIGYVDLFAGPGRYDDNTISTPLRVLQKAIAKPLYAERLLTIFNDKDSDNAHRLQEAIKGLPGIEKLKSKPQVWNQEVGDQIAKSLEEIRTIPILAFIDPWGYKGLTLRLVDAFLKDWGCDCLFFFNYGRINAGLNNPLVAEHMAALFGPERAASLRDELSPMSPSEREVTIVNALATALKQFGHRYVLPFCFKNETGTRTKHHLILVTKHFKGYEVMKDIMAKASSSHDEGVPSFTYCPTQDPKQQLLFELNRPLDQLGAMLLEHYAGRTLTMKDIYEEHSVDRPYIAKNYRDVLLRLEAQGTISVDPPIPPRRKNTFAPHVKATFPRKK